MSKKLILISTSSLLAVSPLIATISCNKSSGEDVNATLTKAKDAFTELYADVYEKRAEAQRIMEEAKKRVEESNTFAAEADTQAPIKEPVEGIEEADAVLLEETKYEEVEVVEFEETLADEELEGYEVPEETESTENLESIEDEIIEDELSEAE